MHELNRNEHCPCWHQVADFNLSKMMEETGSLASGSTMARVNPRWLAPEVLNGAQASVSSDVFAFGVVMWGELGRGTATAAVWLFSSSR